MWTDMKRKTSKFIFWGLGNRVCPEASGDTATRWSIRARDGFCIDQENVGWWSGLDEEGRRRGGGGGALSFPWWLPHDTDVVKIHSNLSVVVIVIIVPAEVIITLGFLTSCLGRLLVDPVPFTVWLVKCCGKQLPYYFKGGHAVETQIHGGEDKGVKRTV